jgi:YVTN family beta-propeller protein
MKSFPSSRVLRAALLASTMFVAPRFAAAVDTTIADNNGTLPLPTGQFVTPTEPHGAIQQFLNPHLANYPDFVANEAVAARLSPDGTTLLVLCAGYNNNLDKNAHNDPAASNQYIFVYDVTGAHKAKPELAQVIQQTNAYVGLVWASDGATFYATGGNDDAVYVYAKAGGQWAQSAKIGLGHNGAGLGLFGVEPNAAGLGLSADGKTLVVANNYNDSISVIDTVARTVKYEHDLRPFAAGNEGANGVPGGEFPTAVAVKGNNVAYVTANRDREVVVVDISVPNGKLITRIPVNGLPNGVTMNADQTRLYVAQDNADQVAVIDTATNTVIANIDTRAPAEILNGDHDHDRDDASASGPRYTGAAPFAVTISPDGKTLYAVNDGANSVAVIPLVGRHAHRVTGLIPTAYAPKDIAFSADGSWMYIINGKSDQGPNPKNLYGDTARLTTITYPGGNAAAQTAAAASNQYQLNNNRSTLVSAPVPGEEELERLTRQVAANNFYSVPRNDRDEDTMEFLHAKIKHVIYIIKENRTFDQVLGDLRNGSNGDPSLTVFGKEITPNFHRFANNFVTLDNFLDSSDASMDGWGWCLQGRATSVLSLTQNINYAGVDRGLSYLSEGSNRNIPTGLTVAQRVGIFGSAYTSPLTAQPGGVDNALPGTRDIASSDAPFGQAKGYIFDAVLAAGGTLRNYGFLTFNVGPVTVNGQPVTNAGAAGIPQSVPLNKTMAQPGITDVFFRGYDNVYPDIYRYNEWKREFDAYVANGNLPTMETVRLMHDHTGNFDTAISGVNTPETQQADHDLAVGRLVEAVAHSPYARDTLIFMIEDDSQDGPDHYDSHRTTAYIVGPYVKRNAVVNRRYNTVNMLRTIEDVLGLPHLNLNTAYQRPMSDVFDVHASGAWTYSAIASTILKTTTLASADVGVRYASGPNIRPLHDASYWAWQTRGFDFTGADRVPADMFNEVLWEGLKGGKPYPFQRINLRTGSVQARGD